MTFTAGPDDDNRRLDRILRRLFPDMPLSGVYRLLRKNRVLVDNCVAVADTRVRDGAVICVPDTVAARGAVPPRVPDGAASPVGVPQVSDPAKVPDTVASPVGVQQERPVLPLSPQVSVLPKASGATGSAASVPQVSDPAKRLLQRPLDIIFENSDLLAVNKQVGIAVHGEGSLDTLVQTYLEGKQQAGSPPVSLSFRSGPLHRLDQPTSGIVVFSKTLAGARLFSSLIQEHRLVKRYLALVDGGLDRPETWEDTLVRDKVARKTFAAFDTAAAKSAQMRVTPLAAATRRSLICAEIGTGRTHQIRAQAALHGHPLAGDKKYNGSFQKGGLLLHAWKLDFPLETGILPLTAPLPKVFQQRIRELFGEKILKISADG